MLSLQECLYLFLFECYNFPVSRVNSVLFIFLSIFLTRLMLLYRPRRFSKILGKHQHHTCTNLKLFSIIIGCNKYVYGNISSRLFSSLTAPNTQKRISLLVENTFPALISDRGSIMIHMKVIKNSAPSAQTGACSRLGGKFLT